VLFPQGCKIPSVKSLNFKKDDFLNIDLFYDHPELGQKSNICSFTFKPPRAKEQKFETKYKIRINENGLADVTEALLNEEFIEE
jgi:hypothetical protein